MRQRGQETSFQERMEIAERVAAGQSTREIANAVGCAPSTVRKWRRRYHAQGRAGLASQMGRPARGVLSTYPPEMKAAILHYRRQHPQWGPETILVELQRAPEWADHPLPSRTQIAELLHAEKLTRRYQQHVDLPQPSHPAPALVHAEWQLDAQGVIQVEGLGKTSLINIIDVTSRLKVESYPCVGQSKPATEDYYLALRRAFLTYGLPQRLSLDHDTVFFDNTSPSPFPTRIHLWLTALGVEVTFIRKRMPTDHAEIERTHQLMEAQAISGQRYLSQPCLWGALDRRREVLNTAFPSEALEGQAPLAAYPLATTSGRPYRPEWEEDLLSLERLYRYLATGRWFRYNNRGDIQLGGLRYHLPGGHHYDGQTFEITFDPVQIVFVCSPETQAAPLLVKPQGLTKAALMGDVAKFLNLPAYQLALPFSVEDRRRLAFIAWLSDTTFPDNL